MNDSLKPPSLPREPGFSLSMLAGDAAVLAWLAWSFVAFSGRTLPGAFWTFVMPMATAASAWPILGHRVPPSGLRRWLVRPGLLALMLAIMLLVGPGRGSLLTVGNCMWFACAASAALVVLRLTWWAAASRLEATQGEIFRWIALAALAAWLAWPFYHSGGIGAGDAHWYAVMLGDFVEQLRAGIFPVWTGQTEYAFNGAVSPLRLAPMFQHEGGILFFLTGCSLGPLALKNAVVAFNAAAIVFAAYAAFRAMLPRRPDAALVLATVFATSPAVLAPIYTGDQIMTFVAVPFLPAVFYGCWRMWTRDGFAASAWIAIGVSGLWLSHPPIATWTSVLVGGLWGLRQLARRDRAMAWRSLGGIGLGVILLGSWPFFSALSLDNVNVLTIGANTVVDAVREAFPGNFLPVAEGSHRLADYQPGYPVLVLFALGAVAWRPRRAPGAAVLAVAITGLATLMFPVPLWLDWVWSHLPKIVLTITNSWPMQRLMVIWVAGMLCFVAWILAGRVDIRRDWLGIAVLALAAPFLVWALREAGKFTRTSAANRTFGDTAELLLLPHNRLITRYAYSSFARAPTYYSHGYMDPVWENRLVGAKGDGTIVSNAAGAAVHAPVAEGELVAVNDNHSKYYNLTPSLVLQPHRRYALILEIQGEPESAVLQLRGAGIFREYALPDSGDGMSPLHLTQAFGTLPTSTHAISLWTDSARPTTVTGVYIAPNRQPTPSFVLAHYRLHAYRSDELPIWVHSLAPYRASAYTPEPAWLETPRMWLGRYTAMVNGHSAEVRRSANNLAMIRLDLGDNAVALDYSPGFWLGLSYGMTIASWLALFALGLGTAWPARR